jgi:eukaryotic-like serine/threonine-protein kinase
MPAKVTLTVTDGHHTSREFTFDERTTCIIGRAEECHPRLPTDADHKTISRNHCLLDINPPDVRVRDFGSLNGTYINGAKIGQREKHQTPEEGAQTLFPEHDLKDGDRIELGNTVFRVGIYIPAVCADCATEISEAERDGAERAPGVFQCEGCHDKALRINRQEAPRNKPRVCGKCGKDVSTEVGENRHGDFICAACQGDPAAILKQLLNRANKGDQNLLSIQGYTVLKELGRGGMGAVYLARRDNTGEQVALKVMLPQVAADARARDMFLRETENTKALKHPNVVRLWEAGCSHGVFFFTLEFCDGGSLDVLLKQRGGPLPVAEAGAIVRQALDGLAYAHTAEIPQVKQADGNIGRGRGLVHRDLKPHNIFLAGSGASRIAKLADYGLAKAFDTAGLSGQTRTGVAAGTPHFMPRQQVINFKYAKPEVDVWAMAASLYFLLTGAAPRDFPRGKDPWQIVLQTEPVPIRKRNGAIPKKLAEVIDRALVDKPNIAFKSAREFKEALEKVL